MWRTYAKRTTSVWRDLPDQILYLDLLHTFRFDDLCKENGTVSDLLTRIRWAQSRPRSMHTPLQWAFSSSCQPQSYKLLRRYSFNLRHAAPGCNEASEHTCHTRQTREALLGAPILLASLLKLRVDALAHRVLWRRHRPTQKRATPPWRQPAYHFAAVRSFGSARARSTC